MKRLVLIVLALASVAAIAAGSASASTYRPYYMDELKVSNSIESHGFRYGGRHVAVDSAFCSGLRRFGVRSSEWGLDKYWHFDCSIDSASGHFYSVKLKTLHRPGYGGWIWRATSASLDF